MLLSSFKTFFLKFSIPLLILILCFFNTYINNTKAGNKIIDNPIVATIPSELTGITIAVTYDSNFSHNSYIVETGGIVTDSGKNTDKGVIKFPCTGEIITKYIIDTNRITTVIKTKYNMSVYDKTDYIFTHDSLYIVNTTQSNAGIFINSNIFVLPSLDSKYEFEEYLKSTKACNMNKKLFFQIYDFLQKNDIKY